eukprot:Awhi_evm2s939
MKHRQGTPHFLCRNGAVLGFAGLYLIFYLSPYLHLPASKLSCRLGALAPLQGLSLIGLAYGMDPLARLLSLKALEPL